MSGFLIEFYVSRLDGAAAASCADRGRIAAESLTLEGTPVRYLRSIFLPEDETCFSLYEAESVDAIREVVRRASLPFERIVEAVAIPESSDTDPPVSPVP